MITEISENFYRITLPMPFRLRHVHAYALIDGANVALFDTGMHMPGAFERLEADLQSIGHSDRKHQRHLSYTRAYRSLRHVRNHSGKIKGPHSFVGSCPSGSLRISSRETISSRRPDSFTPSMACPPATWKPSSKRLKICAAGFRDLQ